MSGSEKGQCGSPFKALLCTLPLGTDVKAVRVMHSLKGGCFLFSSTHSHVAVESTETEGGDALSSPKVHILIRISNSEGQRILSKLGPKNSPFQIKCLIKRFSKIE